MSTRKANLGNIGFKFRSCSSGTLPCTSILSRNESTLSEISKHAVDDVFKTTRSRLYLKIYLCVNSLCDSSSTFMFQIASNQSLILKYLMPVSYANISSKVGNGGVTRCRYMKNRCCCGPYLLENISSGLQTQIPLLAPGYLIFPEDARSPAGITRRDNSCWAEEASEFNGI